MTLQQSVFDRLKNPLAIASTKLRLSERLFGHFTKLCAAILQTAEEFPVMIEYLKSDFGHHELWDQISVMRYITQVPGRTHNELMWPLTQENKMAENPVTNALTFYKRAVKMKNGKLKQKSSIIDVKELIIGVKCSKTQIQKDRAKKIQNSLKEKLGLVLASRVNKGIDSRDWSRDNKKNVVLLALYFNIDFCSYLKPCKEGRKESHNDDGNNNKTVELSPQTNGDVKRVHPLPKVNSSEKRRKISNDRKHIRELSLLPTPKTKKLVSNMLLECDAKEPKYSCDTNSSSTAVRHVENRMSSSSSRCCSMDDDNNVSDLFSPSTILINPPKSFGSNCSAFSFGEDFQKYLVTNEVKHPMEDESVMFEYDASCNIMGVEENLNFRNDDILFTDEDFGSVAPQQNSFIDTSDLENELFFDASHSQCSASSNSSMFFM